MTKEKQEDMIDWFLISDLIHFGTAFIKITVDNNGDVIRERIDPKEMENDYGKQ